MEWIDEHWMFLAPPVTICLIVYRFVIFSPFKKNKSKENGNKLLWQELILWAWLSMPLYSFHQFEEHGYDVYGRKYYFIEYFNETKPLGIIMTSRFITIINLVHVHLMFAIFAVLSERTSNPLYGVLSHSLAGVNALVAHIIPALVMKKYNPGVAQSLIMAPLSFSVIHKYIQYVTNNNSNNDSKNKKQQNTSSSSSWKILLICILFGGPYGHGVALLLPLKLVSQGILNELGFIVWAMAAISLYALVASRILPNFAKELKGDDHRKD